MSHFVWFSKEKMKTQYFALMVIAHKCLNARNATFVIRVLLFEVVQKLSELLITSTAALIAGVCSAFYYHKMKFETQSAVTFVFLWLFASQ